jgi:uncharacterized protein
MTIADFTAEPFLTTKAEVHRTRFGFGVIAIEPIAKNELVAIFAGEVLTLEEVDALTLPEMSMAMQIGPDAYTYSPIHAPADHINHSCSPNLVFDELGHLVAWVDIDAGADLTFDYATADSTSFDDFECHCESENCRGMHTGNDWKLPDIQERYAGHFLPYLQQLIDERNEARDSVMMTDNGN